MKSCTGDLWRLRQESLYQALLFSLTSALFRFRFWSTKNSLQRKEKLSFSVLTGPQNGPPGTTKSASHAGALIYDQKLCFCEGRLASHAFFGCITKNTISSHAKSGRFVGSVFKNAVSSHASRTTGYYNIGRVNHQTCAMRPGGGP